MYTPKIKYLHLEVQCIYIRVLRSIEVQCLYFCIYMYVSRFMRIRRNLVVVCSPVMLRILYMGWQYNDSLTASYQLVSLTTIALYACEADFAKLNTELFGHHTNCLWLR